MSDAILLLRVVMIQYNMLFLWNSIFYQPLFNLLVFTYNLTNSTGLAIIIITLLIKVVLHPFSVKSIKSQKALQTLQPKVDELKVKYKDNKEQLGRELMALYQQEKISPFSSCLPLLVQLPFLIALFQVFKDGLVEQNFNLLYPFIKNPGSLEIFFLGLNLSQASWVLAVVTGLAQFWQAKMLIHTKPPINNSAAKDESMAAAMNKQAMYIMPAMTVFFGLTLPSGLILYWLVNTILTIGQQYLVFKKHGNN